MNALLPLWTRVILILALGLMSGLGILAMRHSGMLQAWELRQYDATTMRLAQPATVPDVVLLAITDQDLARWGWPIPDATLANLLAATLDGGARAVGLDIYRDVPVGEGRVDLLTVLRDPRVAVISRLGKGETGGVSAPADVENGFADIPIDADGVARRTLLLVNTEDGIRLSFALRMAMLHLSMPSLQPAPDDPRSLRFGETNLPRLPTVFGPYRDLDNAGYQIMTRFLNERPIATRVTAQDVLTGAVDLTEKTVVIAVTSDTIKDYFLTPLNRRTGAAFSFGGEVHAATIQQIIDHATRSLPPLSVFPPGASIALIVGSALAGAALAALLPVSLAAFTAAIAVTSTLLVGFSSAQAHALLLPAVPVTLAWALGYSLCFAALASVAWRQRRVMAGIFASQLSESLSAELWRQRKRLMEGHKPVSRELFVTVLLADIEGSTRIGQTLDPVHFMGWISRILDALGACAQRHGGFVEKYTGDGILVVFGAPVPRDSTTEQADDARTALACAEGMRAVAQDLNSRDTGPDYRLRIALNSGNVIAGTLGTSGAMRYNVIGDPVNLAARLEAWIKSQPDDRHGMRPICLTEATAQLIGTDSLKLRADRLLHDDGQTYIDVYTSD